MARLRIGVTRVGFSKDRELSWDLKDVKDLHPLGRGRVRQDMPGKQGAKAQEKAKRSPVPSVSSCHSPSFPFFFRTPSFFSFSFPLSYNRTEC